jgi:hypothetical protein
LHADFRRALAVLEIRHLEVELTKLSPSFREIH